MKVKDLVEQKFENVSVVVSYTYNEGYELQTIKDYPQDFESILESEISYISKTDKYDLVIHLKEE